METHDGLYWLRFFLEDGPSQWVVWGGRWEVGGQLRTQCYCYTYHCTATSSGLYQVTRYPHS